MADPIREALQRLLDAEDYIHVAGPEYVQAREAARAALAAETTAPAEPDTDAVLTLAAIIRRVDGSHSLGAAALAEAILSHPSADSVFQPPAPAPAADPLQGFAANLIASQRPMDPDVAVALTPEARWEMYDGEPAPAADDEREELARLLDGDAKHLVEVALARECHKTMELACRVICAAALLRQLPPEGLDPASYDAGGLVQIQRANRNPEAWAIRCGVSCMSTAGEWDIEPMPSHRTDEWLANHRWPSAAAAWAALQQARRQDVGDE